MWNLIYGTMNLPMKHRLTDIENRLVLNQGGGWGGMGWELRVVRNKLLHIEWINKAPLTLLSIL